MPSNSTDERRLLSDYVGSFTLYEAVQLAEQVCTQITDAVGSRGFHGGVRPDNIYLGDDGAVTLGKPFVPGVDELTPEILEYIAPEVFLRGTHEPSGDVYSLGLVLYAILNTGRLPFLPASGDFSADDRARATQKRVKGEIVPPPRGDHPAELVNTVLCAVNISPVSRFHDAAAFREALVSCDIEDFDTHASIGEIIDEQKLFDKPYAEFTAMERLMAEIISSSIAVKGSSTAASAETTAKNAPHEWRVPWKSHVDGSENKRNPDSRSSGLDEKVRRRDGRNRLIIASVVLLLLLGAVIAAIVVSINGRGSSGKDQDVLSPGTVSQNTPSGQIVVPPPSDDPSASGTPSGISESTDNGSSVTPPVITPSQSPDQTPGTTPEATPSTTPNTTPSTTPSATPSSTPSQPPKPLTPDMKYEVVMANVSWSEAGKQAAAKGGHLATISSEAELNMIIDLIDGTKARFVWLGAKRDENGDWVWDLGETTGYFNWAKGEPSKKGLDGTPEDYLMLVRIDYKSKWFYNDIIGDPVGLYPKYYKGTTAYVIEYE